MQFTRIPDSWSVLGAPLVYAFTASRSDFDLRIASPDGATLYGAKRFAAATEASVDIAPCLRRALAFAPSAGPTGVCSAAGRRIEAVVQLTDRASGRSVAAPVRCFVAAAEPVTAPALLTAMPRNRLIPAGACDELTLLTDGPLDVALRVEYGLRTATGTHRLPAAGLHLFRLDTADFAGADRITVDAGACGTVLYSLTPPVQEAVRLAWRSRAGSIEHYTFPVETTAGLTATRLEACGPEGRVVRTTAAPYRTLRSALERREVLEALSELLVTPEVWLVEGARCTPVVVTGDRAVVHAYGALRTLEVTVCPKTKPAQPWSC